ncbi:MAG: Clp protease N-terminal domain-containing protein [Gaiellaceae bacterium]|jgi:ATP-dependent Clp protease ATP-binding subunit ClpA
MRWLKSGERKTSTGPSLEIPKLERELGVGIGERGRVALSRACAEMERSNHRELGAEHLIVGVIQEGGPAGQLLLEHGMTLEEARGQIAEALWEAGEPIGEVFLTPEAANILATAAEAAGMRGHRAIEPEHMTYGFACSGFEITSRVLHMVGVDRQKLLKASEQLLSGNGH